jgi:uncharacterized membrane protein YecN with MAPEG domain
MLPVTLTFAGVAALLNIWLGWRVGQVRMAEKVLTGDGGNHRVLCRMRAHANYVEYTPFVLILIAAIEFSGGWLLALWAVGAVYFLARIAHAFGMDASKPSRARMIGISVTMLSLFGLAVWALVLSYGPAARMTAHL